MELGYLGETDRYLYVTLGYEHTLALELESSTLGILPWFVRYHGRNKSLNFQT